MANTKVTTNVIADDAITAAKIADDAVGSDQIADDAVTAAKLANSINTDISAKLPLAGGTMTGNLLFADSVRARFGADNDLQIFHDTSNSYIENTGTGDLILQDSGGDVRIKGKSNEDSIVANNDGSVELYYDNAKKFETTSAGVTVAGTLGVDGLITGTTATASGSTNTTALASTAFVQQEITTLIGGAPSTLNDLNELAAAINDDANYNSTLTTALATKVPLAGGTMTGELINTSTAGLTANSTSHAYVTINSTSAATASWLHHKQGGTSRWLVGVEGSETRWQLYSSGTKFAVDTSGNVNATGNLVAAKLTSSDGVLELDDNGSHNGVINAPASLRINIDSDGNGSSEWFGVGNNQTAINDSNMLFRINEDGKVGIGTTSPASNLHVYGATVSYLTIESGNGGYNPMIRSKNADRTWDFGTFGDLSDYFSIRDTTAGGTAWRLTIDTSGKVGIGTTSPDGPLHVMSASAGSVSAHASADELVVEGSGNAGINILSANNGEGGIYFGDDGDNDIGRIRYDHTNNSLDFFANAAERMTIINNGNVGINDTDPEFPLTIGITSSTTQQVGLEVTQATSGNDGRIRFKNTADSTYVRMGMESNGTFFVEPYTGSQYLKVLKITNQGAMQLQGNESRFYRGSNDVGTGHEMYWTGSNYAGSMIDYAMIKNSIVSRTNGAESADLIFKVKNAGSFIQPMTIKYGGNVGIGTTAPGALLNIQDATGPTFRLTRTAGVTAGQLGAIDFGNADVDTQLASIMAYQDGSTSNSRLMFFTEPDSGALLERMRITSLGDMVWFDDDGSTEGMRWDASSNRLGIGSSNPANRFQVKGPDAHLRIQIEATAANSTSGIYFLSNNGAGATLRDDRANSKFQFLGGTLWEFDNSITMTSGLLTAKRSGNTPMVVDRLADGGKLIDFFRDGSSAGYIQEAGGVVSLVGFSGAHESSGISADSIQGTVVSTVDELDGPNHAKIKISSDVGDARVYGVISNVSESGKIVVAAVGIGSVLVTGACAGGDLLESNGDGTAKVQSDDIIRSKTIGKVTMGDSDTSATLVSCVLYCG